RRLLAQTLPYLVVADNLALDALWRHLQFLLRLPPDRLGNAAKATAYPRAPSAQRDYRENRYPANRLRDEFHAQPPVLSDRLSVDRCGLPACPPLSRSAGSQKKPQRRLRRWRCRARFWTRVLVARSSLHLIHRLCVVPGPL